jgi:integrase
MTDKRPLSAASISAMRPGGKDLADTGESRGLRITCGAAGTKSFFYRYTSPVSKKLTQVHIGHFPTISLAEARVRLQELKLTRKQGHCPAAELKAVKHEQCVIEKQKADALTVKDLIDFYLETYIEDRKANGRLILGARKAKGQSEVRRTLYGDAVRLLGDKPASEVTRKDVVGLVVDIIERGANVQAGNVLRELSAAYEFAIGLERFSEDFANPALLAKSSLRQAKIRLTAKKGRRVLSDNELKQLLVWLPGSVFTPTQKNILRFTLWTGCRTGEICEAKWADVDLELATWHLKATKTNIERFVQLSSQAVDFLRQLKLITGDYLFPSQKTGLPIQQKSITEQAWQLRTTGRMLQIEHWVPHDLRRTVRTGLSRLGCPNEVAEAILGHARSGIEGTYDLHRYEKECRYWLQKWSDHLVFLISGKAVG